MDLLKLKVARVQANVSVEEIAAKIGLNPATVYRKLDGKSEFTVSELVTLKKILKIDRDTFCNIFFGDELAEMQE